MIQETPASLVLNIASHLEPRDISNLMITCKRMNRIISPMKKNEPPYWRNLVQQDFPQDYEKMYKNMPPQTKFQDIYKLHSSISSLKQDVEKSYIYKSCYLDVASGWLTSKIVKYFFPTLGLIAESLYVFSFPININKQRLEYHESIKARSDSQ